MLYYWGKAPLTSADPSEEKMAPNKDAESYRSVIAAEKDAKSKSFFALRVTLMVVLSLVLLAFNFGLGE